MVRHTRNNPADLPTQYTNTLWKFFTGLVISDFLRQVSTPMKLASPDIF